MDVKNFPQALRICRKLNDWSQGRVAEEVGASQQAVASWESRRSSPRPETYTKLVEVFGADSLVAKHPPQEDDLMVPRAERFVYAKARTDGSAMRIEIPESPHSKPEGIRAPIEARRLNTKLSISLPEDLRVNVDSHMVYRGVSYPVSYLSEKLCAIVGTYRLPTLVGNRETPDRLRSMVHIAVRRTARESMRQLVVLRAIAKERGEDSRRYVAIITPHEGLFAMDALVPEQIEDEAYLLGLKCHLAYSVDMAAAIIRSYDSPYHDAFHPLDDEDENEV